MELWMELWVTKRGQQRTDLITWRREKKVGQKAKK
jgi:hypothetical protein